MKKSTALYLTIFLSVCLFPGNSKGQHPDDSSGFLFKVGESHESGYPVYYELTQDYTIDLTSYFLDTSKMPEGTTDDIRMKYLLHAFGLPPVDWDFLRLEKGGTLTIKKGYRWDGASRPCKPDCDDYDFHYRATAVHDALYDLMRLGYLDPDVSHGERGELPGTPPPLVGWLVESIVEQVLEQHVLKSPVECFDEPPEENSAELEGDLNRALADLLLNMISVEDGQEVGGLRGAQLFFALVRFGGACRTYYAWDEEDNDALKGIFYNLYVPRWKFYPSELTAQRADTGIRLDWKKADDSGRAPAYEDYYYPGPLRLYEYLVYRNGEPLHDENGELITVSLDATQYLDATVEPGKQYKYVLKAILFEDDPWAWSNDVDAIWLGEPGNALRLGFDGAKQSIVVGNPIGHDLIAWDSPQWDVPLNLSDWIMAVTNWDSFWDAYHWLYTPDSVTLEAWVYPDATGNDAPILSFEYPPSATTGIFPPESLHLASCGSENRFCIIRDDHSGNDPVVILSDDEFLPEQWHHVAFTAFLDPQNECELYVDGTKQAGFFPTEKVTPWRWTSLSIGGSQYSAGGNSFKGMIDEARIWGRARTQEEIQAEMCTTLRGNEAGLMAMWHFDNPTDDTGTSCSDFFFSRFCTATDVTKNANDLQVLSAYPRSEPIFAKSEAMTPKPGTAIVELDGLGNGSISADQLMAGGANDFCMDVLEITSSTEFSCGDLGQNTVDVRITDKAGVARDEQAVVEVVDLMPPNVSDVIASRTVIKSASDEMVRVTINDALVSDNCRNIGLGSCRIISVTGNEPLIAAGGPEEPDYDIIDDITVNLRATSSPGVRRVYTIAIECVDGSGSVSAPATVDVRVSRKSDSGSGSVSLWLVLALLTIAIRQWRLRLGVNLS